MFGPEVLGCQSVFAAISMKDLLVAAIGSLAGAWGGAYAAQRIADASKQRERLELEIKSCNELLELVHGIANSYINAKEQQVESLRTQYRIKRVLAHWHHQRLEAGDVAPGTAIELGQINFSLLNLPMAQVDGIEKILSEKLTISGRTRTLVGVLRGCISVLGEMSTDRNAWLRRFQAAELNNHDKARLIFGLPNRSGDVDDTYGNLVEGIHQHVDDCIMFAVMLGEDARKHGLSIRRTYRKDFGRDVPRVGRLCFEDVEKRGMMPDRSAYQSWDRAVASLPATTRGRLLKSFCYWKRVRWRRFFAKGASARLSR